MLNCLEVSHLHTDIVDAFLAGDTDRFHDLYDLITTTGGLTHRDLICGLARRNLDPDTIVELNTLLAQRFIAESAP